MWNQELEVSTRLECLRLALQTTDTNSQWGRHKDPESVVNFARIYFEFASGQED